MGIFLGSTCGGVCNSYLPPIGKHPFQFSLRSLLIVTTLVALALGMFVWLIR